MNPVEPYPFTSLLIQAGYPLPVLPAKLVDILIPLAVILAHYLDYRLAVYIVIYKLLLSRGPRSLLGCRWSTYWLGSLLGRGWLIK
jgi:hypothetical protein